jgi:hypothetical protein
MALILADLRTLRGRTRGWRDDPPGVLEHFLAMALTSVGCEVHVRLPRWDDHLVERLELAGIGRLDAPDRYVPTPLEATLLVPVDDEAEAKDRVIRALRGWTVLLPLDFATA